MLSDPDTRRRYDAFGADFRQVPEDVGPEHVRAAAGRSACGAGTGGRHRQRRRRRSAAAVAMSNLDDLLGGMFGGASARLRARCPAPTRRPSSSSRVEDAYRGGRRIADPVRTWPVRAPTRSTSRPASPTASGSGWPVKADRAATAQPPATCTWSCGSRRTRATGSTAATSTVDLPLTPWEAALGATVAVDTPGGEAKVNVPPGTSSGTPAAAAGSGHAEPERHARRPVRRGADHGAAAS